MKFDPIYKKDKQNRTITIRSAEVSDAEALLKYLKETTAETPFLLREPDEIQFTLKQEQAFIQNTIDDPGHLMLIADADGELVGNCSVSGVGAFRRYSHRCGIGIALYQKYCNSGIGRMMLEAALLAAKEMGYEQAELEVFSENKNAIALYQKLGFRKYGTFPDNVKYSDGSYADAEWMMKKL